MSKNFRIMEQVNLRMTFLDAEVEAVAEVVRGGTGESAIGILLHPPGNPKAITPFSLSIADAAVLRDMLDTALKRHQARKDNAN